MEAAMKESEKAPAMRLFLLSLIIASFAAKIIDVVVPLLLVDVAGTFDVAVGTAGRVSAISTLAAMIVAVLTGAFAVRFKHRMLLLTGVFCIIICAIGCFWAPNFLAFQAFYAFNGIGSALVGIMGSTLIGEFFPLEKKAKALGLLLATGSIATLIGAPVTSIIADAEGWRSVLSWFMLPIAVASLVLVFFVLPSKTRELQLTHKKEPYLNGFRSVLTNVSAVACLAGGFLVAAFLGGGTYGMAFLQETFSVSTSLRALIMLTASAFIAIGSTVGGQLVNRYGRKRMAVTNGLLACTFGAVSYFLPNLWLVLILRFASALFGGMALVGGSALNLEQVPKFRGTMMSLGRVAGGIGAVTGVIVAGGVLNLYNYQAMGLTIGLIGISGAIIMILLAKDPIKTQTIGPKPS